MNLSTYKTLSSEYIFFLRKVFNNLVHNFRAPSFFNNCSLVPKIIKKDPTWTQSGRNTPLLTIGVWWYEVIRKYKD